MRDNADSLPDALEKITFSGGCYWCIEAVFQALRGVECVEQGFAASIRPDDALSEAVIVHFDPVVIDQDDLIAVHLHTHSCTAIHSLREKYRSAVYAYNENQKLAAESSLKKHQSDFEKPIITRVLYLDRFQLSDPRYHNYYASNPEKPFCRNYIHPKLQLLRKRFARHLKPTDVV